MGYTIKRVPTDFHHPLEEPWPGYVNPYVPRVCAACEGSGDSPEAKHLRDLWYGYAPFRPEDRGSRPFLPTDPRIQTIAKRNTQQAPFGTYVQREAERLAGIFNRCWRHHLNADDVAALVAQDRLRDLTHDFTSGKGWSPKQPAHHPTPEEVNAWSLRFFGHDAINAWIVIGAECKRLGVPSICGECDGTGETWETEEIRQAAEAWTPTEPPHGRGVPGLGDSHGGVPDHAGVLEPRGPRPAHGASVPQWGMPLGCR